MESEALVGGLTWEWRRSEGFGEMEKWGLHLVRETRERESYRQDDERTLASLFTQSAMKQLD